jgi:hypothetical protein
VRGEALGVGGDDLVVNAAPADVVNQQHDFALDFPHLFHQSAAPNMLSVPHVHQVRWLYPHRLHPPQQQPFLQLIRPGVEQQLLLSLLLTAEAL